MIRRGVIFFVLEKMAAVLGVPNPAVYAAFRGETLAQFLATRKLPITYSVAGGSKAKDMSRTSTAIDDVNMNGSLGRKQPLHP